MKFDWNVLTCKTNHVLCTVYIVYMLFNCNALNSDVVNTAT